MVQKIVTFDVALKSTERQWVQKIPEVYTNDLGSVSIQFKITDCTDTELTGSTAIVLLKMRDGSFFQGPPVDVTRTLNVFSYILKENEGNHDGLAEIQLIVTIGAKEFATQKYNFKVITGLDSEVAREIMIYDWSTLTAEARAYIDQFTADELLRDAEFDNNQFDRNVAFNAAQGQRTTDFGLAQTQRNTDFGTDQAQRVSDFNAAEAARVLAFNNAETARAAGYDADHSRAGTDHTGAVADRANAATDRTNAATDRTNAASDRTLAGTDHTRAESDHTRADADSATVAGFNARVVAEETATANNKISAVKGKTFADVDARFEDVEADVSFMTTNLVPNGNFSNGLTGWIVESGATGVVSNNKLTLTGDGTSAFVRSRVTISMASGKKYYSRARARVLDSSCQMLRLYHTGASTLYSKDLNLPIKDQWYELSGVVTTVEPSPTTVMVSGVYADSAAALGKVVEIQYVSAIDLTAIFGAGKEPTAAEMDRILARFTNSWFDGTKNLFAAKTAIEKQIALDSGAVMDMTNKIVNGDFSNGTTGWAGIGASISAANNTITNTGNGTSVNPRMEQKITLDTSHKYYVAAKLRVTNNLCSLLGIFGWDTGWFSVTQIANPVINNWYKFSGVLTTRVALTSIVPCHYYADGSIATGKVMEVQYVEVLDLTATFGAGNEPTVEQMDAIMAKFENSWFDGTKNLFQAKASLNKLMALDQEKANKVQEAWITPTLLNGWTSYGTDILRMYKDEFGVVHIRGRIRGGLALSIIMTLPVGYRPIQGKYTANVASIGAAIAGTKKLFMIAAQGATLNHLFTFDGVAPDWTHAESFLAIDISYRAEA